MIMVLCSSCWGLAVLLLVFCWLPICSPSSYGSHSLFYKGPDGIVYGPFPQEQLFQWCDAGYFDTSLQVSFQQDQQFFPLQTLLHSSSSSFIEQRSVMPAQQTSSRSSASPKRAFNFLKKRASKLLSKSKRVFAQHDDTSHDFSAEFPTSSLEDVAVASDQNTKEDVYNEQSVKELVIEDEEGKFVQKNMEKDIVRSPTNEDVRKPRMGLFDFAKARKLSVKSLGSSYPGLWDDHHTANRIERDSERLQLSSRMLQSIQNTFRRTMQQGLRLILLNVYTSLQYCLLFAVYLFFQETQMSAVMSGSSNQLVSASLNWQHVASMLQTAWRPRNMSVHRIVAWCVEEKAWIVIVFAFSLVLTANVLKDSILQTLLQSDFEYLSLASLSLLLLSVAHVGLLLRNSGSRWISIALSVPLACAIFAQHRSKGHPADEYESKYLSQDISTSRNRWKYYRRLLRDAESTLQKYRLLSVLQRLEPQERNGVRSKELGMRAHVLKSQSRDWRHDVCFYCLLALNIAWFPRLMGSVTPLEMYIPFSFTTTPSSTVQRVSSSIQLLGLTVVLPLLKWIAGKDGRIVSVLDSVSEVETKYAPPRSFGFFASQDKSKGLVFANLTCRLQNHEDSSPLLVISEEFSPGIVSLIQSVSIEDIVVVDSVFQHICGIRRTTLSLEGEVSLHGSDLSLSEKLTEKDNIMCFTGSEERLFLPAGLLSGFSLQRDFDMSRYKLALEVSRSQSIFSQLPTGASTFLSSPELKGILHMSDYESLLEEDWARLHLCRTLTQLNRDDALIYLSLPLCNFTPLEEEVLVGFVQSLMSPHQVVVISTRHAITASLSNSFIVNKQHLEKIHNSNYYSPNSTVHGSITSDALEQDYLKDWE